MKISIVTATWNSESTITDCLESISSQSYGSIEHIVVDGGSSDSTMQILLKSKTDESRIISEPDNGIYDALNKGISLSSGDVIGFLHSDDLFYDEHVVASIAEVFGNDESICAVYGDLDYISYDKSKTIRKWRSEDFRGIFRYLGWMPAHPTFYVRKDWYEKIGGFDTDFRISADYYSILQLFSFSDFKAQHCPKTFVRMRVGGISNRSLKTISLKMCEDFRALRKANFSLVMALIALLSKNIIKLSQFFWTSRFKVRNN
jgi:glycosyltransferase involved in cell wall biosynthesis